MKTIKKILANDKLFLIIISFLVIVIMEIPFLYGLALNDHNHYYTGLNTIAVIDGPVYLSYIEQARSGHFLFRDLFNSNDNFKFLNPFWLLVGLTARIFKISGPAILQIYRLLLIPVFLWALYKLVDLFYVGSKVQKKICFLFSLIISGFGVFIYPLILAFNLKPNLDIVPIDLWASEANNFMVLRYYPHVILATSLIFLIFYYFYKSIAESKTRLASLAGFLALILFSFHPFQVPLIYAIPFVYIIALGFKEKKINWLALKNFGLLVLISLPSVIYYLYQLLINEKIFLKAVQNTNWAPNPLLFIFSFGLGLFLAFYYFYYLVRNKKITQPLLFIMVWFGVNVILVFLPWLNWQRRMLGGFMAPLSILAFSAIILFYQKIKTLPKEVLAFLSIILIFFLTISNLYVYSQDFKYFKLASQAQAEHGDLIYISNEVKQALDFYKAKATDQDIILSSYESGDLIPGLTGQKVFIGHPIETVGFSDKRAEVEYFFQFNIFDQEKKQFLEQNKITYIYYSDWERRLGDFKPADKDYLQEVFKNNQVTIYKVNLAQTGL